MSAERGNVLLAFLAACPDIGQESKKQVKLKSCQQLNIKKWRQILHYKWFENCTCQYLRKNVQFYICISDCVSLLLVCCSVAQSCPTLCNPMDCRTPASMSLTTHHLPKFAQVHVHCIGDAIPPSHPLTPSSPSDLNHSSIRDFSVSLLFTSDEQNTGASASSIGRLRWFKCLVCVCETFI